MATTGAPAEQTTPLKRVMGPGLLLLFVIGDILGTGIYALTGKVAADVGGVVWLPFALAFLVAFLTAFSYLELVTKYPRAAGAALYTHKAFNVHFLTFIVAFAVLCSGLTSASSASKAFAANFAEGLNLTVKEGQGALLIALLFITAVALINLRGVGESVWANVVLTCIELSGLLIIILIGLWGLLTGGGDLSQLTEFNTPEGTNPVGAVTAATALAFFAMVGFEDSVNMAEETKNPSKIFPKAMLTAMGVAGAIYVLVSISAISLVPADKLSEGDAPLLEVVRTGAPGFPLALFAFITMFAVSNSALINMLMASRLMYGMSRERVLPKIFGRVLPGRRSPWTAIVFTTLLAICLISFADLESLGGTTSFLLLCVFTVVNIAVLVLRRQPVEHDHFRAPAVIPVIGTLCCFYLASPLSGRAAADYKIAGILMVIGVVLWVVTFVVNHLLRKREPAQFNPENLDNDDDFV